MKEQKQAKNGNITDRLFGGLNMSWMSVIIFSIVSAVLTTVFLIVPIFKGTSFIRVGETFEAWIFFAVIIMSNCKKPLESAEKTFVFFLISQPLIYLMQVPFSQLGWGIFGYYRYWFYWTLATFPMAFIGWYIKKKNWLSLVILSPVIIYLTAVAYASVRDCIERFPHMLAMAIFCTLQIICYIIAFLPDLKTRLVGFVIPFAVTAVLIITSDSVSFTASEILPDDPSFSSEAAISVEDESVVNVQLEDPERGTVYINAQKYGTTDFIITDGENEYVYTIEIYKENGVSAAKITAAE